MNIFIKLKGNILKVSEIVFVSKLEDCPFFKENIKVTGHSLIVGINDHDKYIRVDYDTVDELNKAFEKVLKYLHVKKV